MSEKRSSSKRDRERAEELLAALFLSLLLDPVRTLRALEREARYLADEFGRGIRAALEAPDE